MHMEGGVVKNRPGLGEKIYIGLRQLTK